MNAIRTILLVSCLAVSLVMYGQEKFSRIKIRLPDEPASRSRLIGLLDADHFNPTENGVIVEVGASVLSGLKESEYEYEVLIDDVTRHFVEQSQLFFTQSKTAGRVAFETTGESVKNFIETPSFFSTNGLPPGGMGGYYTFAEMVTKMDQLVAAFPNLVQKTSIGQSIEGRDIWCIKISDNVATDEEEPEVLYLGLQHAREAITGTSLIFFAQYLAQNFGSNPAVTELVSNREIFIVPCVNPDGYVYNQINNPGGGGMQRKNRRNVGSDMTGQKGVDLNRNYGVDWADCAGASSACGSNSTSNETYWGSAAFSEPETRAIRDLCYERNFVAAFDQHCSGPYYSLPFGRRSYHTMNTPDRHFYTYIPAVMGKHNGHRAGDSYATVKYEVAGGAKDWWLLGDIETYPGEPNKKGKIYGMTGEAGGGGFWAPSNQIIELCKNLCFQNMQLAFAAGSYVEIQDKSDVAITSSNPYVSFKIQRVGLGNEPVTISLIPLQNIVSVGAPVTVNSLPQYYDTHIDSIHITVPSALGNGQVIRYVWRVQTGGVTIDDTVTKMFHPNIVFSDDMESGSVTGKWNVSGGWGYTSAHSVSGSRSITESPSGNYSANDLRIAALKNPADLSDATAAYISFWTRHRAENFRDILRLQLSTNSTDGFNGDWVNVSGRLTVQESNTTSQGRLSNMPALTGIRENWSRELIEIPQAYYNSNNVWFRFEFSSDGTSSNDFEYDVDDGFYIDDFKIVKSMSPLVVLPVQFISFNARLQADETVRLTWEAITDQHHDHFVVERSTDGHNYHALGIVASGNPFQFIDLSPAEKNNYYRLRQVDKDGTTSYSQVVTIYYYHNKPVVSAYPNPVNDVLSLRTQQVNVPGYRASLVDMAGRTVGEKIIPVSGNGAGITFDMRLLPSQLYLLVVRNEKNEIVSTFRVMKQ